MAKQIINIGSSEQSGDGESLRSAFDKINDNFGELYLKDTSDFDGQFSSLAGTPTTLAGYGITDAATTAQGALAATAVQPQTSLSGYGITDAYTKAEVDSEIATATSSIVIQSGSTQSIDVVAADSTILVDSVNGTLNATTLTGALPAIDGSALTSVTTAFSNITSTPTTIAGYGITDAQSALVSGTNIKTVNGESLIGSGNISISGGSGGSSFTNIGIGADDSTIRNIGEGESFLILGGTGITTASDAEGNITITGVAQDFAFSSLTGKPTTIAGYGITDAFDGAFGSLSGTPTTLSGYGITDAASIDGSNRLKVSDGAFGIVEAANFIGHADETMYLSSKTTSAQSTHIALDSTSGIATTMYGAVDFVSGGSVDFTGSTVTGLPAAYSDSDVDTHLNTGSAGNNEVLSWTGSDYDWVAQSGGGAQSRGTVTGTTSSLADAAEADLDITGFKAYALLTITTDRAARVRLYVTAATRTADASRAEGVDPTSDAGVIAEVITTGAETVIISPGAYGFNLESSPTTTIPCRVTNKSGGTSTVQVDLNILQLEA
jgi:hypothetical protein